MMLRVLLVLSALLVSGTLSTTPARASLVPEGYTSPGEERYLGLSQFSMDMYQALSRRSPGENLFFSPLSVATALSMTLMGAKGRTYTQLGQVLGLSDLNNAQIQNLFNDLTEMYQNEAQDYELRTANMVYSSHLLGVQQSFSSILQHVFRVHPQVVDFGRHSERIRTQINSEVERHTNNKIRDLIPSDVLNGDTRMVLVNAIYFKGLWQTQFRPSLTTNKRFWVSEDTSVEVPMMFVSNEFAFTFNEILDASVLSLDYKGSNLSMVIVLPQDRMGLARVETQLAANGDQLATLAADVPKTTVSVSLPRFKLEYSADLVPVLEELGASDLVSVGLSDLSGIGGSPGDLYVSNVLHKSFIEVNEEGTEAAAATAVVVAAKVTFFRSFNADHPFLFFIRDNGNGNLLFMGRVTNL